MYSGVPTRKAKAAITYPILPTAHATRAALVRLVFWRLLDSSSGPSACVVTPGAPHACECELTVSIFVSVTPTGAQTSDRTCSEFAVRLLVDEAAWFS